MRYWLLGLVGGLFLGGGSAIAQEIPPSISSYLRGISDRDTSPATLKKAYWKAVNFSGEAYCLALEQDANRFNSFSYAIYTFPTIYRSVDPTASLHQLEFVTENESMLMPLVADMYDVVQSLYDNGECSDDLEWIFDR